MRFCAPAFSGNYSYSFFTSSQPGTPSINFWDTFQVAPGASYDHVFAQFNPAAAGAQPGTYMFYRTAVTLNFNAFDSEGKTSAPAGTELHAPARLATTTTVPSRGWWPCQNPPRQH